MAYKRQYRKKARRAPARKRNGRRSSPMRRGTMLVTFEYKNTMTISSVTRFGQMFIGDHPQMGMAKDTNPAFVDPKYGDQSGIFQFFKPTGVRIRFVPEQTERTVIATNIDQTTGDVTNAAFAYNNIEMLYDKENTLSQYQSSITAGAIGFNDWIVSKEYNQIHNSYKPFSKFYKIKPRTRVEADGTVVKSLPGGYYSNSFSPAYGYICMSIGSTFNPQASVNVGQVYVTWYGIMRSSGDINPPT